MIASIFPQSPRCFLALLFVCCLAGPVSAAENERPPARNVILVTTDGLRWQEVFHGADDALLNKADGGVAADAALTARYGGDSPEERRQKLMPFLWSKISHDGQIYGHRERHSLADVTNTRWFSYPGYNELLTGHADDARITSNKPIPNPNVSVLEWLQGKPGFAGKVAAATAWDAFPGILNVERSHLPVWSGSLKGGSPDTKPSPGLEALDSLVADIPSPWPDECYDAFVQRAALEILGSRQPRVLYIGFGETDTWAHARRYDQYLDAAHRVDHWLGILWEKVQSMPTYRDNTTLLFTTDHGRGKTPKDWTSHHDDVPDSGQIWLAALGPDTPALGERTDAPSIKQAQVAATVARAVGEDYLAEISAAAPVLAEVFKPGDSQVP